MVESRRQPLFAIQGAFDVMIARGNIYLSPDLCSSYFSGSDSVALLSDGDDILIIPLVQQAAGGLLLKIRNLKGDRVIHAQEFFRQNGMMDPATSTDSTWHWDSSRAALRVSLRSKSLLQRPIPSDEL